jgi:hypothetical protein
VHGSGRRVAANLNAKIVEPIVSFADYSDSGRTGSFGTNFTLSGRLTEADIIVDHCVRSDRNSSWIGQIELAETDLVTPDLTKEILEYLDRQLFTGTSAIAETKWREASIVTHRLRLTIHYTEYRAETAVGYSDLSSVFDFKRGDIEWAAGKPYLLRFLLINLSTGRYIEIAFRIELFWILPMYRAQISDPVHAAQNPTQLTDNPVPGAALTRTVLSSFG